MPQYHNKIFAQLILIVSFLSLQSQSVEPGSGYHLNFADRTYADVFHGGLLDFGSNDYTVEFWVFLNSEKTGGVIGNMPIGNCINRFDWCFMTNGSSSWTNFMFYLVSNSGFCGISMPAPLVPGRWHHIAGTREGASFKVYRDGVLTGSLSNTRATTPYPRIRFGSRYTTNTTWLFDGKLDDVRIWNRAKTQTEIREGMCKKLSGSEPGLLAYYTFDDQNSAITITDSTSNALDASITTTFGAPDWGYSGAPIGDTSTYVYPNGGVSQSDTLRLAPNLSNDVLIVKNVTNLPLGLHIYYVNQSPNTLCGASSIAATHGYWGIFPVVPPGVPLPAYSITYDVSANSNVNASNIATLTLFHRPTNADTACPAWTSLATIHNVSALQLDASNLGYRNEIILDTLGPIFDQYLLFLNLDGHDQQVDLTWALNHKDRVSQFHLWRSVSNAPFQRVATLPGDQTSYSDHLHTKEGFVRYYVEAKSLNTTTVRSETREIFVEGSTPPTIWPNPLLPNDLLNIDAPEQIRAVSLYAPTGKILLQTSGLQTCSTTLSTSHLAPGVYILQLSLEDNKIHNFKIVKAQ